MIKIFATDMDHTFLDENSTLPQETQELVNELADKNKMFIVASGRTLTNLEYKFQDIKHNISFIADNGGILKHKGEILHIDKIDEEVVRDTIVLLKEAKDSTTVVITPEMAYTDTNRADHLEVLKEFYTNHKIVDNLTLYTENVVKITALSLTNSSHNFKTVVAKNLHDSVYPVESGSIWIDIMNEGVNKGKSLQILMDRYDIHKDQVVSFGDYFNDFEMIKLAKYGYAVENAVQEVKDVAYDVIGANTENSVIQKIREHLDKEK